MSNQVASVERMKPPAETVRGSETTSMLQAIERLAMNPDLDLDRFERLIQMQERLQARDAERQYYAALAEMQESLPIIEQNGRIKIAHKDDRDKDVGKQRIIQSTAYAKYEDIIEACKPVLKAHGFSLSHRADREQDRVIVTGILAHSAGHKESTILPLALDTTGSKNNVQSVGSSIQYGRRYTTLMLLNIVSRAKIDADDDGKAAGAVDAISSEQVEQLRVEMTSRAVDEVKFCEFAHIDELEALPAGMFDSALRNIQRKPKTEARDAS